MASIAARVDAPIAGLVESYLQNPDTLLHPWVTPDVLVDVEVDALGSSRYVYPIENRATFLANAKTSLIAAWRRAPGAPHNPIELPDVTLGSGVLIGFGAEVKTPAEEAVMLSGNIYDLRSRNVIAMMEGARIARERRAATAYATTGNYDSTLIVDYSVGGLQWDAAGGTPVAAVADLKDRIKKQSGRVGNVLVMGRDCLAKARNGFGGKLWNGAIQRDRAMSYDDIATALGVDEVWAADAVYNSGVLGAALNLADIWDPDDAWLLSVPSTMLRRVRSPGPVRVPLGSFPMGIVTFTPARMGSYATSRYDGESTHSWYDQIGWYDDQKVISIYDHAWAQNAVT